MKTPFKSPTAPRPRADGGHSGVSANMMKKKNPHKKQRTSVGPSKTLTQPRRNIVGCRIQHIWKEGSKSAPCDSPPSHFPFDASCLISLAS
uniref:Uncharacterized protein n=1 Tax=Neolamprologus brichardi TaxID=32507 RepID=A0A3Q4G516_NEOBR